MRGILFFPVYLIGCACTSRASASDCIETGRHERTSTRDHQRMKRRLVRFAWFTSLVSLRHFASSCIQFNGPAGKRGAASACACLRAGAARSRPARLHVPRRRRSPCSRGTTCRCALEPWSSARVRPLLSSEF